MEFKFLRKDIKYSPGRFFNREVSLLKFHERVLEQSIDSHYPLLEKLRFLAISGSNLDEFYMVRIAGLKEKRLQDEERISIDGMNFKQQLSMLYPMLKAFMEKQKLSFEHLKEELAKEKFYILDAPKLKKKEISHLRTYFKKNIIPFLEPVFIEEKEDFPFLSNLGFYFFIEVDGEKAILTLPVTTGRFIRITPSEHRYIALEDVVSLFLPLLYPGSYVKKHGLFSVIRDTLLNFDEPAEDIISYFEKMLGLRNQGAIVLLNAHSDFDQEALSYLMKNLKVEKEDVMQSDFLGYRHLVQLANSDRRDLLFKKYNARKPERVRDFDGDHFKAIAKKDMVIHHPYESYEVVVNFLKQAAHDNNVTCIKQTLYRTNKESPIMNALMEAAKEGKDVTAFIELRARFDEEANLAWAKKMQSHGVKVIFGHPKYKFHGKVSLIARKEKDKVKKYVHYGTGNYNPVTANVYTDLSFFTCNKALAADAEKLFKYLETKQEPKNLKKLVISPFSIQNKIIGLINKEAELARAGKPAQIWMKCNSLYDDRIIDALYEASQAGVKIYLVIRGICSLRPGIKGFSDNIRVQSIIGRFLEHSRIFCFSNGERMPSPKNSVFISSADLMRRNMIKRIETMVPINNPTVHSQILDQIMLANIKDMAGSYLCNKDMEYSRRTSRIRIFGAQRFFMTNPSLSGRGSAKLKKHIRKLKLGG